MKSVIIFLTTMGIDTGPFNIYTDVDLYSVPCATGITQDMLSTGFTCNNVADTATIIRVKSMGVCNNYIDFSITTPTPTPPCTVFMVTDRNQVTGLSDIYTYDPESGTSTYRFNVYTPNLGDTIKDIANTETKLWLTYGTKLMEYNITLTPFTAVYSRTLELGQDPGFGLCVLSGNPTANTYELIATTSGSTVAKYSIDSGTTVTVTPLFVLTPSYGAVDGDIMYNPYSEHLIITQYNGEPFYITEYDLSGTVISGFTPTTGWLEGIFCYNGLTYVVGADGQTFLTDNPYLITSFNTGYSVNGSSQSPNCISSSLPLSDAGPPPPPPTELQLTSSVSSNGAGTLDIINGEPGETLKLNFQMSTPDFTSLNFASPMTLLLDPTHMYKEKIITLDGAGALTSDYQYSPTSGYGSSCSVKILTRSVGTLPVLQGLTVVE